MNPLLIKAKAWFLMDCMMIFQVLFLSCAYASQGPVRGKVEAPIRETQRPPYGACFHKAFGSASGLAVDILRRAPAGSCP